MDNSTRQAKRAPVTLKIKFKSETLAQFIERYAVDVSPGGIFIRTKEPLAVGTPMKFEFQLRDATPLITGEGTVVWTRENDPARPNAAPGMGVRFDRLGDGSQPILDKILAEKNKAGGAASSANADQARMFTDQPTRVAPSPLVGQLIGESRGKLGDMAPPRAGFTDERTDTTPLPRPMPFHSDAEEFPDETFEEATKVRTVEDLIAATAQGGPSKPSPRATMVMASPPPPPAAAPRAMPPVPPPGRGHGASTASTASSASTAEPAAEPMVARTKTPETAPLVSRTGTPATVPLVGRTPTPGMAQTGAAAEAARADADASAASAGAQTEAEPETMPLPPPRRTPALPLTAVEPAADDATLSASEQAAAMASELAAATASDLSAATASPVSTASTEARAGDEPATDAAAKMEDAAATAGAPSEEHTGAEAVALADDAAAKAEAAAHKADDALAKADEAIAKADDAIAKAAAKRAEAADARRAEGEAAKADAEDAAAAKAEDAAAAKADEAAATKADEAAATKADEAAAKADDAKADDAKATPAGADLAAVVATTTPREPTPLPAKPANFDGPEVTARVPSLPPPPTADKKPESAATPALTATGRKRPTGVPLPPPELTDPNRKHGVSAVEQLEPPPGMGIGVIIAAVLFALALAGLIWFFFLRAKPGDELEPLPDDTEISAPPPAPAGSTAPATGTAPAAGGTAPAAGTGE